MLTNEGVMIMIIVIIMADDLSCKMFSPSSHLYHSVSVPVVFAGIFVCIFVFPQLT